MKTVKPSRSTLDLCARAIDMVKAAGFIFDTTSMKTEASYYRWPDRSELLRIAAHSKGKTPVGLGRVVSKITYNGCVFDKPGEMKISDEKVVTTVALAIGQYFLRSTASPERDT